MKDLLNFGKAAFWPFVVGVGIGMILLTFVFGFVPKATATSNADKAADQASLDALVPICVQNAQADEAKLTEVQAMSSYKRDDAVQEAGWIPYPKNASKKLKDALNDGCVDALKKLQ